MPAKIAFTQCPVEYGVALNPSDAQHRVTRNEIELGKVYYDRRPDGSEVLVKILKNGESSTTLLANQVLKPNTATGRFNIDGLLSTTVNNAVIGVVEDGYKLGVKPGYWFRAVVDADHHPVNLTTANGAQATVAVGGVVVADDVDGTCRAQVTGTDTDASIRPNIENRIGRSYVATTNGAATQAGMTIDVKIKLLDY